MRDVLVTGGAGFIGSNLVGKLLDEGYRVTVLDNFSSGYRENLQEFSENLEVVDGDIRNHSLLEKLIMDKSIVFHLAAMVSVPESIEMPQDCFDINLKSSLEILNNCVKYDAKFVFASSAAVYGDDDTPVKTEDIPTRPLSPYGITKRDVEELCKIYNSQYGLEYTCFRNFNVYGPKQDVKSAYAAVIPTFINHALRGEQYSIHGDGEQTRDFIYVSDVAEAFKYGGENPLNDVFNLGCNEIRTINDLSSMILEKVGISIKPNYTMARPGDIKHSRASSDKFQRISGWYPKVSFEEGIEKTIEYYKNGYE